MFLLVLWLIVHSDFTTGVNVCVNGCLLSVRVPHPHSPTHGLAISIIQSLTLQPVHTVPSVKQNSKTYFIYIFIFLH